LQLAREAVDGNWLPICTNVDTRGQPMQPGISVNPEFNRSDMEIDTCWAEVMSPEFRAFPRFSQFCFRCFHGDWISIEVVPKPIEEISNIENIFHSFHVSKRAVFFLNGFGHSCQIRSHFLVIDNDCDRQKSRINHRYIVFLFFLIMLA
jgi:hypothetical protein